MFSFTTILIVLFRARNIPIERWDNQGASAGRRSGMCFNRWSTLRSTVVRQHGTTTSFWNSIVMASSRSRISRSPTARCPMKPFPAGSAACSPLFMRSPAKSLRNAASEFFVISAPRLGEATRNASQACAAVAETLAAHDREIPFALLYLIDSEGVARLAGAAGVEMGADISPLNVDLSSPHIDGWPMFKTRATETLQVVEQIQTHFATVPAGPWSDPPHTAVVVPIPSNKTHDLAGLMVAGVSARLQFDQDYRDFFGLVASQVAAAIANAREYEEEKKRSEALAELDRAKTAFFSNVSHEFRTPLTLMLGPVEDILAGSRSTVPPDIREQLQVVHRNGLRLQKLVNTLLDFSRIEAGRVQASYEPTDLSSFTAELASNFRSACEKAGLQFEVDCLPLAEPVFVDRDMWEKIVLNLLSNAFKFTLDGRIEVTLRPDR